MGWCHEFGCQITSGCNHPMKAGATACTCAVCDTVCTGRFSGCPEVFARSVAVVAPSARPATQVGASAPARPSHPQPQPHPQPQLQAQPQHQQQQEPRPQAQQGAGGMLSKENGARILHWMRAEFDGVRSQLHAMAGSLAQQQALVAGLAGRPIGGKDDPGGDEALRAVKAALAELAGSAGQFRTEASRMQDDVAELRRETARIQELEQDVAGRLPQVVSEAVQPELRAALREVEAITAGLREEAAQLRALRDSLQEQLPRLVEASVREALAHVTAPQPAAPAAAGGAAPFRTAPEANHFAPEPAVEAGALADEPTDQAAPSAFGAPPAARPAPVAAADGGVGEDPLACSLPGLVVGPSLALGVSAALKRAGLRRRRRRRANRPSPGLHRRDPFATQLTRRVDRYGRARSDLAAVRPATPSGNGNGKGRPPSPPSAIAIGYRDGEEVVVDLAETGALVVVGPSSADVARFVTTAFLAHTGPSGGEAVVVGDLLPPAQAFPGLSQPPDLGAALNLLRADSAGNGSGAPVLLVAREASDEDVEALAQLRAEEAGRPLLTVLVDVAPDGATALRLEANERVAEVSDEALAAHLAGARLYTLGREAASELLAVLASARTDDDVVTAVVEEAEPFEVAMAESPSVSVELLGHYRIQVGGVEIRAGLRAKARELLAFYLLHPAGTTLDAAVEALWPEADPGRGSEWFWTALGNLRSRLRDATGEKKLKVIERDGDRYRVEPLFDVDLWRLEQALSEGAAGAEALRAAAYDKVAQTYTGDLLAGQDWAWAETPREDLRQRVLDVLVWLGDVRWASGDARGSWQALQRAVEVDPYAEQIYRRIMRLQSKLGRPDDATATFSRLQARLVEIDLQPTPESEKLYSELGSGRA